MKYTKLLLFFALAAMMTTGQAAASPLFLGSSTAAFAGDEQPFALDTGANHFLTDYASNAYNAVGLQPTQGLVNLDFDFGGPFTFSSILYTDRTTVGSPSGNGFYGGLLYQFATTIRYEFSNVANFSTLVYDSGNIIRTPPGAPSSYLDFQTTTAIPNVTAEYVRFEIVTDLNSNGGAHSGAADLSFTDVAPEPSTSVLLLTGLLIGCGLVVRQRRASRS